MSAMARITAGSSWTQALQRAAGSVTGAEPVADHQALATLAQGHVWVEQFDEARLLINRTVDAARQHGTPHLLPYALAVRAELGMRVGRWTTAYADADEAVRWAEELHQHGSRGFGLAILARIDAGRGRRDLVEEWVARSGREVGPYGIDSLHVYDSVALGLAALTDGEPDVAVEHLGDAWRANRRLGMAGPAVIPYAADLAEAYVRCGRRDEAEEVVAWLEERATATGLCYPAMGALRCRGLLAAGPAEALAFFAAAAELVPGCPMPFESARTMLYHGELLRRLRHPRDARQSLREAERLFQGLGARPWEERAARELAAAGVRSLSRAGGPLMLESLSPQELQIARMVAAGRNNVETATALFLSRKTVESHLTRIYRKLEVRSRSELAARLTAHEAVD
jgi:DNA-binding CsgD family transcriptional regulator